MKDLISTLFLFVNTDFEKIYKAYRIEERVIIKHYEKNETVSVNSDSRDKGIYLLATGSAEIKRIENGTDIILRHIGTGDSYGAATLFPEGDRCQTVIECNEKVTVIVLNKDLIFELINKEPVIAENYIRFLSDRVCFLNKRIAAFTAGSTDDMLYEYIKTLPFENNIYTVKGSYTELCNVLNLSRASLYRAFDTLEEKGILKRTGKTLELL